MILKKNQKATQVGGNNLCEIETSVEKALNDFATQVLVAETKAIFPNARLIVSGP